MKHLFIGLFFLFSISSFAQGYIVTDDKPFVINRTKDSSLLVPISRAAAYQSLSPLEKEYIYWVNKMRSDPGRFYIKYVDPFLRQFPEAESEDSRSLARDMRTSPLLQQVFPASSINVAAADHADYLASIGKISHTGRGGRQFPARMKDAGITACAGEVIFDGKEDVLMGLILLLIDHKVPGQGHRKALLNPDFARTGVAIRYTKEKRAILVQDFACNEVSLREVPRETVSVK